MGGLQRLADWLLSVVLTGLGLAVVPGNLQARMAGASLGFWLSGRYAFALVAAGFLASKYWVYR